MVSGYLWGRRKHAHTKKSPALFKSNFFLPCLSVPFFFFSICNKISSLTVAACHASLHVDQGIRGFPSRLSHEAFPRGFSTGLSHVPPWCESIFGLKVEAVQGKKFSLEWTETSGGLKWTGMGEFNSDDHYIYYCGQESLRRNGVAIMVNKNPKCSTWMQSQK